MIHQPRTVENENVPKRWTSEEYYRLAEIGLFENRRVELLFGQIWGDDAPIYWTQEEYERMADAGLFEGQRVELIFGEIYEMSPENPKHAAIVGFVADVLALQLPPNAFLRIQNPLSLRSTSNPEPDVAVISGRRGDFFTSHPSSALLVVEVSDSSVAKDLTFKQTLYASAVIPEYWLVNLVNETVDVYQKPVVEGADPAKSRYASIETRTLDGEIAIPWSAETSIRVAAIFGK